MGIANYKLLWITLLGLIFAGALFLSRERHADKDTELTTNHEVLPALDSSRDMQETTVAKRKPPIALYHDNDLLAANQTRVNLDGELYLPNDIEQNFSKNFTFPDGETISINFHVVNWFDESLDPVIDDGKSPLFYESLKEAALSGNDQAAVLAFKEVTKCINGFSELPDLDNSNTASNALQVEVRRCSEIGENTLTDATDLLRQPFDREA